MAARSAKLAVGGPQLGVEPDEFALGDDLAERDHGGDRRGGEDEAEVREEVVVPLGRDQQAEDRAEREVGDDGDVAGAQRGGAAGGRDHLPLARRAEREDEHREDVEDVDRVAAGVMAGQHEAVVDDIGDDEERGADREQGERQPLARARRIGVQPGEGEDQHQVADRVGDRDDGREQAAGIAVGGRAEHRVPDHRRAADRDRQRVEADPDRAAPARVAEFHDAEEEERIEGEVERIGERGEGVGAGADLVDQLGDLAGGVGGQREGDQSPAPDQAGLAGGGPRGEGTGERRAQGRRQDRQVADQGGVARPPGQLPTEVGEEVGGRERQRDRVGGEQLAWHRDGVPIRAGTHPLFVRSGGFL